MLYTQPFLLNAERNAAKNAKQPVTKGGFFDFGTFDFLIAEVHKWLRIAGGDLCRQAEAPTDAAAETRRATRERQIPIFLSLFLAFCGGFGYDRI